MFLNITNSLWFNYKYYISAFDPWPWVPAKKITYSDTKIKILSSVSMSENRSGGKLYIGN